MKKRVLLVRHAAIEGAGKGLLVGSSDVPAAARSLQELDRLGKVLGEHAPEVWWCSPLLRARQTAARLAEWCEGARSPLVDDRLREIDFGRWEMKGFAEIAVREQERIASWSEYTHFVFPEGEAVAAFCARLAAVLADLHASGWREMAVVTHGGVIRTLICLALGLDPKNYLLFDVRHGSLTVLDLYPEGAVLAGLNLC